MAVVDRVLAGSCQAGHLLNKGSGIPDFNEIGIDHDVDFFTDQPTGDRVGILDDLDRARATNANPIDAFAVIQLLRRQFTQGLLFLSEFVGSSQIAPVDQSLQKVIVGFDRLKVAAATEQQGLVHDGFQVTVLRFHIPILVGLANIDALRHGLVVVHQVLIPIPKLSLF